MYGDQILGKLQRVAIVVNATKSGALPFARELAIRFEKQGIGAQILAKYPIDENIFDRVDMITTVGGDGTLLGIAAMATKFEISVFAVNHGEVGFLSTIAREHALQQIENLKTSKFRLSERLMLAINLNEMRYLALNDVVVRSKNCARLTKLTAIFNGNLIAEYRADGVMVSSPTGSTAYNFSAGGPITHPNLDCMIFTPICQHGCNAYSLVLPASGSLVLTAEKGDEFAVYCDGNPTGCASEVIVSAFEKKLKLMEIEGLSFFDILRKKL
ncbi:MAG: NAD(+)/NADH kinase [Puniceicoccales bacterium]|jgi:NAD+ kinase|nr:NAD(+)/NADH kinase [Puniceicoccales bacterium]